MGSRWTLPEALHLGPDRAGSTWLFRLCRQHPQVHVPRAKDVYFFDREYHRGLEWYARQYRHRPRGTRAIDISHDYLISADAAARIARDLPHARMTVFLREPVERVVSAYAYSYKQRLVTGTLREAVDTHPGLLRSSRYATALRPYLSRFPREQFFLGVFDDLRGAPVSFATDVLEFIGVDPRLMDADDVRRPRRPTAASRSRTVSRMAKAGANLTRRLGFPGLVGAVKEHAVVDTALYREPTVGDLPEPHPAFIEELREHFRDEVREASELTGLDLVSRWGYDD